MALTPEEVKRMEEQANLSDRFNKASDRYVAGNDPRLRAMEREQVLRQREGDVFAQARQRRQNANADIARMNPGRFSAQETRALLGMTHTQYGDFARMDNAERAGLRQHELDMLRQEGQDKIGVAHETALGMRGQGVEAADFGYKGVQDTNATKLSIAEKQESGLTEREKAALEANQKLEMIKGQNALGVANTTGEWTVKNTAEANKGLVAKNELERQRQEAEIATKIQTAMINAGAKIDAAKAAEHSRIIGAAIQGATTSGKDLQTALAELAEAKKNNPELLSSIKAYSDQQQQQPPTGTIERGTEKKFPNGDVGVWDGTKWVKKN